MDDTAAVDAYLKEYEKLRDEVQSNLSAEGTLLNFGTALFGALVVGLWQAASDRNASEALPPAVGPHLLAFAPLVFAGLWLSLMQKMNNSRYIAHYIAKYLRQRLRDLGIERPLEWDFWKFELAREAATERGWWADFAGKWLIAYGGRFLILVAAPFGLCMVTFCSRWEDYCQGQWAVALLCWIVAAACVGISIWHREFAVKGGGRYKDWAKELEGLD